MDGTILDVNEKAFIHKYKRSLQERIKGIEDINTDKYDDLYRISSVAANEISYIPQGVLFVICVGVADGKYLRKLMDTLADDIMVLIYEPEDSSFLYSCCKNDLSDIIDCKNTVISLGTGQGIENDLKEALQKYIEPLNITHMYAYYLPGYKEVYSDVTDTLVKTVKEIILPQRMNLGTEYKAGRKMYRNMLYSLTLLNKNNTVSQLFDNIADRSIPVIIVGAGPSLAKNAKVLQKMYDKAIIVACTHAMETLYKNTVQVHLMAMVDYAEGHDFTAFDHNRTHRMLFAASSAMDIQNRYCGKGIYYSFQSLAAKVECLRNERTDIDPGNSVVTAIMGLFEAYGFEHFILVGVDLAYTKEGISHSGSHVEIGPSDDCLYTEGIDREIVKTRNDWIAFKRWIEAKIQENTKLDVIDATEGGAYIKGTRIMTLEEVANGLEHNSFLKKKWIEQLPLGLTSDLSDVKSLFASEIEKSGRLQLKISDAIALNRMIRNQASGGGNNNIADLYQIYDKAYREIVNGDDGAMLREYCPDIVYNYVDKAQFLEANGKITEKIENEYQFFCNLRIAGSELRSYLSELLREMEQSNV